MFRIVGADYEAWSGKQELSERRGMELSTGGAPPRGEYGGVAGCRSIALPATIARRARGRDPDDLKPDTRVRFPGDPGIVSLVQVQPGAYWDFVFRTAGGGLVGITLDESEVGDIEIVSTGSRPCSLARLRGRRIDNAVVESFWARMQTELLDSRK